MGRAYVHLSSTEEEALAVGRRHEDEPVLVRIDTFAAIEQGAKFHRATAQIWLSPALPAEVCSVPDLPEESAQRPAPPSAPPRPAAPPPPRPASPPSSGVRVVSPDPDEGFKRRTRKKNRR
jgi:hypothetical protein